MAWMVPNGPIPKVEDLENDRGVLIFSDAEPRYFYKSSTDWENMAMQSFPQYLTSCSSRGEELILLRGRRHESSSSDPRWQRHMHGLLQYYLGRREILRHGKLSSHG